MVEWQFVVLALQILLLAASWLLFQRARGELSAHAAKAPVLSEVQSLQERVKRLLAEMEAAADAHSARLEDGCDRAAAMLTALETALGHGERDSFAMESAHPAPVTDEPPRMEPARTEPPPGEQPALDELLSARPVYRVPESAEELRNQIYALADKGRTVASIARAVQRSEDEVESLLTLRRKR